MKIAVITGASSGIGREFVLAVDKRGKYDEIWVIARREERLRALQSECSNRIRPMPLDLSSQDGISAYGDALEREKPVLGQMGEDALFRICPLFL